MLYQLANGRVINISIDDYLKLSDTDLQDMVGFEYGNEIRNPFFGSSINKSKDLLEDDDDEDDIEEGNPFDVLSDEDSQINPIDINNIPDENYDL